MTVSLSSGAWMFEVHAYGDGSSTSVTFDLLELPLGLDYSVGLWSSVKFRSAFVDETNTTASLDAITSLSGSELTLSFRNNGNPTSISSGSKIRFVLQGVR